MQPQGSANIMPWLLQQDPEHTETTGRPSLRKKKKVTRTTKTECHLWNITASFHENSSLFVLFILCLRVCRCWLWRPLQMARELSESHWRVKVTPLDTLLASSSVQVMKTRWLRKPYKPYPCPAYKTTTSESTENQELPPWREFATISSSALWILCPTWAKQCPSSSKH